jgi:hypothetical protein
MPGGINNPINQQTSARGYEGVATPVIEATIAGEAYAAWRLSADGIFTWGDGTEAPTGIDVNAADDTMADAAGAAVLTKKVRASTVYDVEAVLIHTTNATDDVEFEFTGPASATLKGMLIGLDVDATVLAGDVLGPDFTLVSLGSATVRGATGTTAHFLKGIFTTSTTAGTFSVLAAKGADASTDGTFEDGSFLTLTPRKRA